MKKHNQPIAYTDINQIISDLRESDRLKQNVDYSLMIKYNTVYVQCFDVYSDMISTKFNDYNIPITISYINTHD